MRILLSLVLLAVAAFCCFGLLATFEPVENALAFRVGYGIALVACLLGVVRLLRGSRDGG